MRDSIFAKIEDLRQIVNNTPSYLQEGTDGKVYLDIRSEAEEFVIKMSEARIKALLKKTRAGLNEEALSAEAKRFFDLQIEARNKIARLNHIKNIKKLKKNSIRLGLDLAGGIHIVLGVDLDKLTSKLRGKYRDYWKTFMPVLAKDNAFKNKSEEEREAEAKRRAKEFLESRITNEIKDAPKRAREVIQNRVDQFGVSEVSIRLWS